MEQPAANADSGISPNSSGPPAQASTPKPKVIDLTKLPPRPQKKKRTPSKKAEGTKKKSEIWDHFINFERVNDVGILESIAKCNYCLKEYGYCSAYGTSTLWKHLTNGSGCPEYPYKERLQEDKKQKTLQFQPIKKEGSDEAHEGTLKAVHYSLADLRKELAIMIILDEMPFRTVEKEGFQRFVGALNPKFSLPSRITVARDVMGIYVEEKAKLKKLLKSQRVSLTTDTWSSIQNLNYMCLTAHWIDKDWNLNKKILSLCLIANHKGDTIGKTVEACLLDWGIDKIFTVTVDNASSNDTALRYLSRKTKGWKGCILDNEFMHVRCSAHILNLIVKEGLSDQNESISAVRNAVRFVRSSPARTKYFKASVEAEKIPNKSLLCLDVETRWNSTYLMLEASEKFERAFDRLKDEGKFGDYFDDRDGPPTTEQWQTIRCFIRFLKMFYLTTKKFSGSKYVTTNLFFNELMSIRSNLWSWSNNRGYRDEDIILSGMARNMTTKYEKYWVDFNRMNFVLIVANVLDPRYKMKLITFCFAQCYGKGTPSYNSMVVKVEHTLRRLYEHYHSLDSNNLGAQTVIDVGQPSRSNFVDVDVDKDPALLLELQFAQHLENEQSVESRSELGRYLADGCENLSDSFDILMWWKQNSTKYPVLSQVAREVLAIPVSTVASESAFSTSGRVLDSFRSSLSPKMVEALVCGQNWLRSGAKFENIFDVLNDIEEMEDVEKDFDKTAATVTIDA